MKNTSKLLIPLPLVLLLASCHSDSGPSPVENFVAMVDAEAAVQELQYQQQQKANQARLAQLAQNAYVRENDTFNVLYSPSGAVIFQGGPASTSELVWISPAGSAQVVDAMTSNLGTYVAFTPQAIYVNQPATGTTSRLPRKTPMGIPRAGRTPSPTGAASRSAAATAAYPTNSLQQLPQETPTSPSTEV